MDSRLRAHIETVVLAIVHAQYPGRFDDIGAERIKAWLDRASAHISAYGGSLRADLLRYVELMMSFGPTFAEHADWAATIFDDPNIPSADKLALVVRNAPRDRGHVGER